MPLGLIPFPRSLEQREGAFAVTADARISGAEDTDAAARLLADGIAARTGVRVRTAPAATGTTAVASPAISLRIGTGIDGATESYRLTVAPDGVDVDAADAAGLQHAVHTVLQLCTAPRPGAWHLPAVRIADAPRFTYRGVMLDVARHFFPAEVVERLIDRAAALKFTHLHLHLSDDQGWRLALEARPELTARASATAARGDEGGYYTRADWERIVAHAAGRHITVVPEIDVPGHTHAVGLAYPELAADPVITAEVRDAAEAFGGGLPVAGQPYTGFAVGFSSLRIREEATYGFLADVLGELATLTPGPYLHIGGDEALGTSAEDYASFLARVTRMVTDLGKTPVAWHEAGAVEDLAPGTIGQYWNFVRPQPGAAEKARAVVARGGRLILSPADVAYLDMKVDADTALGLTWAEGPTSTAQSYAWEPTEVIADIDESDILGVEAALWTETIATEADIEAMVFPRLASVAEIAWSPASAPERSWSSFRERLAELSRMWDAAGIRYTRTPGVPWPGR